MGRATAAFGLDPARTTHLDVLLSRKYFGTILKAAAELDVDLAKDGQKKLPFLSSQAYYFVEFCPVTSWVSPSPPSSLHAMSLPRSNCGAVSVKP